MPDKKFSFSKKSKPNDFLKKISILSIGIIAVILNVIIPGKTSAQCFPAVCAASGATYYSSMNCTPNFPAPPDHTCSGTDDTLYEDVNCTNFVSARPILLSIHLNGVDISTAKVDVGQTYLASDITVAFTDGDGNLGNVYECNNFCGPSVNLPLLCYGGNSFSKACTWNADFTPTCADKNNGVWFSAMAENSRCAGGSLTFSGGFTFSNGYWFNNGSGSKFIPPANISDLGGICAAPPPPPPPPPPVCTTGGLVPCGRNCDDLSTTGWDESAPCNLCHLVLIIQLIIEFLVKLSAIIVLFVIALSGLLYMFSSGNSGRIETAKSGLKYALLGFAVIFIAWAIVATILAMLGYIDPINGEWYVMNCEIKAP